MTPKEFDELCAAHDWFYAYSDDNRYYKRGKEQDRVLMNAIKADVSLQAIYSAWAKYKVGSFNDTQITQEELDAERQRLGVA